MSLDLVNIFRFQLHPADEYQEQHQLHYMLIQGQDRAIKTFDLNQGLDQLALQLGACVFEGYRDRMPVFVEPEPET